MRAPAARLVLLLSLGLGLVAARGLALAAPGSPQDALIEAGSQKLEDGDLSAALERFERAARLDSRDPRPRYLAAVVYEKKAEPAKAERLFREALTLDAKLSDVRAELGALLQDLRRFDEAAAELRQAVHEKPDLGDAWFNLGQAELARGKCAEASPAFARAAALKPGEVEPLVRRSIALRACKQLDESVKSSREAVQLAPQNAEVELNLGMNLEAHERIDEARQAYAAAIKLKADYAAAYSRLGGLELHAKRPREAKAAFDRAMALSPSPLHAVDVARALRDLGELSKAESALKGLLAKDPKLGPARLVLGQLYAGTGRCAELDQELRALGTEVQSERVAKLRAQCRAHKVPSKK